MNRGPTSAYGARQECHYPGCPGYAIAWGLCANHQTERPRSRYADYPKHVRCDQAAFKKARRAYLTRHPICVGCGDIATILDHIKPHRGDAQLYWDSANWQPLCLVCHGAKTKRENQGGYTPCV